MPAHNVGDLLGMHEHAAHFGGLVGTAEPASDPLVGPAAGTWPGQDCREVAGGKADQRVFRGQCRHHHFAGLVEKPHDLRL